MEKIIKTWNNLTAMRKRAVADRWITNESNLDSWNKDFNNLSELKKKRVVMTLSKIKDLTILDNIIS